MVSTLPLPDSAWKIAPTMNRSTGRLYQSVCDNATVEEVLQCINNAPYSLTELVKMVTRDLSTGPGPQSLMDEQNWISDVTLTDYGRSDHLVILQTQLLSGLVLLDFQTRSDIWVADRRAIIRIC